MHVSAADRAFASKWGAVPGTSRVRSRLTARHVSDPATARADAVIRSCVRHGFCPQTCPTYLLTGDENDSPRGRIDLIHDMLASDSAPNASTVAHLDSCLSCLGCETTCAARVDYRALIDHAREFIETRYRRPWRERLQRALTIGLLTRPAALRAVFTVARLTRGLHGGLPTGLRHLASFLPVRNDAARLPYRSRPQGPARARVALHAGCVQQVVGARINAASARLLTRLGCEVVVPRGAGCCGALELHVGRAANATARAKACIAAWETELDTHGLDHIVITAAGCGTAVKDYPRLLADEPAWSDRARRVSALACDLSELVSTLDFTPLDDLPALPLAYHDACSLRHGQRVTAPPRHLLETCGFELIAIPEGHVCCGSAGSYNLLQPAMAARLGERKATAIHSTPAMAVVSGNLGCMVQIERHGLLPVLHTAELLDWASGGPRPEVLSDIAMDAWPPRQRPETPQVVIADDEINFWTYTG